MTSTTSESNGTNGSSGTSRGEATGGTGEPGDTASPCAPDGRARTAVLNARGASPVDWPHEDDVQWAAVFEFQLLLRHDVPPGLADRVLAEVREAVEESGQRAGQLLGDPRAYAATVAAERVDDGHRGSVDLAGLTPAERVRGVLYAGAAVGALLACVYWFEDGIRVPCSPAAGAFVLGGVGALVCTALALGMRAAGRCRALTGWGLAGAALVAVTILAATALPQGARVQLPAPLMLLLPVLFAAAVRGLPMATLDTWLHGPVREPDGERWIRRLDGLLRGRHGLSRREAREHTAEVRSHLAESGASAQDAYGDVAVYAARIAGAERRPQRRARRELVATALWLGCVLLAYEEYLREGDVGAWQFWLCVATVLWVVLRVLPQLWRASRA